MILSDTPYPEIFLAMEKEGEKVSYALNKEERKAMRAFDRCFDAYGLCYSAYYTVPSSKNRYLLWYYMPDNLMTRPIYYRGSVLLIDAPNGNRRLISIGSLVKKNGVTKQSVVGMLEYNGHFLSRYRERARFTRKLSTDDLITTLFGRCMSSMTQLEMEKMNFNHEKYDENARAWQIGDGVSFGSQVDVPLPDGRQFVLFQHKTFVTEGMLKGEQAENVSFVEKLRSLETVAMQEKDVFLTMGGTHSGGGLDTRGLIRYR